MLRRPHSPADRKEHLALLLEFLADREPAPCSTACRRRRPARRRRPRRHLLHRSSRPRRRPLPGPPAEDMNLRAAVPARLGRKRLRPRGGLGPARAGAGGLTYAAGAPCPVPAGGWEPILRRRGTVRGRLRPAPRVRRRSLMSISVRTSRRVSASFPPTRPAEELSRRLPPT